MQIIVQPAAAADMDEVFLWYERRLGLGNEFLQELESVRENVAAHPARSEALDVSQLNKIFADIISS